MGPIRFLARLKLVNMKSHASCQLNEMADELADQGCASDEEPVLPGPQKYGSLLLSVRTSMHNLLEDEDMGHRLPRDETPNKAPWKSVTTVNTMRAAKLRSTIFVREARRECYTEDHSEV